MFILENSRVTLPIHLKALLLQKQTVIAIKSLSEAFILATLLLRELPYAPYDIHRKHGLCINRTLSAM